MSDLDAKPASQTARFAAICRAIHALRAEQPKILDDIYARALAGFDTDDEMLSYFDAHPVSRLPGLPMMFSLRSRYTEDQLVTAIGHGVEQYVILGAGLDSFAHRRLDLMERVDVYEVDHPASQAAKREHVAQISLPMPSRLHYAPIDFEQQSLADGLVDAGFNRERPFFACLLGITQYLTHSAVLSLFRDIAGLSTAGCSLVVEFIPPFSELGGKRLGAAS